MVLMALADVTPGMVLGVGLRNREGHTLLGPGVTLTAEYIRRLRELGYTAVWIDDEDTRDVPCEDPLSEPTRLGTHAVLAETFALAAQESAPLRAASLEEVQRALARHQGDAARQGHPLLERLGQQADRVIEETLDRPVLTGLHSIRTHHTETFHHCLEVTVTAVMLGRLVGYDRETLRKLAIGCLLHDVGLIFVPDAILQKPGPLTAEETRRVQDHPTLGYLLLRDHLRVGVLAAHVAYQHHERQDGTGYPRGLRGTNRVHHGLEVHPPSRITPLAEIAAVADFYEACGADRPHRLGYPPDQVWRMVQEAAGTHLNRELVEVFLTVLPPYPRGTQVEVTDGPWTGYRGVVVRLDPHRLREPVVRVLTDPAGRRVEPLELDVGKGEASVRGIRRTGPARS